MGKNQTSFKKGHKVPKEWREKIIKSLKGRKTLAMEGWNY